MQSATNQRKVLAGFLAVVLALVLGAGISAVPVLAESGTVYTCAIHPCYAHPVTGEIEDFGGEASYATGQGMVESALHTTGILEVTDSGGYYLTVRLRLMDYTSNHSFWVQSVGDSSWSAPALGITGNGTDDQGSTTDVCIQVPSENCVVRGSMYVEPMGRDVIFYLYPSDFTIGNHTDMSASMVTGSETENQNSGEAGAESTQAAESLPAESSAAESTREESSAVESDPAETTAAQEESLGAEETGTQGESLESGLQNSITQAAVPSLSGEVLSEDQGLNLSTGESGTGEAVAREGLSGARIAELTISLTFSGLILLAVGSGVAYWFRKTGNSFEEEDDEE